jgi:hypothetical protein
MSRCWRALPLRRGWRLVPGLCLDICWHVAVLDSSGRPIDPSSLRCHPARPIEVQSPYEMELTSLIAWHLFPGRLLHSGENSPFETSSQRFTSSTGSRSSISGNSSLRGSHVDKSSRRDGRGIGSRISRSPSLRRTAWLPGSSRPRGIRSAWLLPLRNRRTTRSS